MRAMHECVTNLQHMCGQKNSQLQMKQSKRERMTKQDHDNLQAQCNNLHRQLVEWVQTSDKLPGIFLDKEGSQKDFVVVQGITTFL